MSQSTGAIGATRLAGLVAGFARSPAYAGLADSLTLLVGDGRIAPATRLPSERDLSTALGVSRTTVTRAYAALVESGFAEARQGAGTFTRVPVDRRRAHDRTLMPGGRDDVIDLNCAAGPPPPGIAAAYVQAVADLPTYLGGHGYFPAGVPRLQEAVAASYDARGLPTRPEQVMITAGALSAAAIVAQAFARPGTRVLVETPTYPNGVDALRHAGARLAGLPVAAETGWDLDGLPATLRQTRPALAYLIPDLQNPTGHVMSAGQRERVAADLARSGTTAIVDEAHRALLLDGEAMPPPFAAFAPGTITLGSASKSFWGGLRIGWVRVPDAATMAALTEARVRLDLGAPVVEQLALARLLEDPEPVLTAHRARLREQRAAVVAAVERLLPDWSFRVPAGGLCLWCRLPEPLATDVVVEAERRGVVVAPGPVFALEGGLDHFVRIPWTRPVAELERAVEGLAASWHAVRAAQGGRRALGGGRTPRVIVA